MHIMRCKHNDKLVIVIKFRRGVTSILLHECMLVTLSIESEKNNNNKTSYLRTFFFLQLYIII